MRCHVCVGEEKGGTKAESTSGLREFDCGGEQPPKGGKREMAKVMTWHAGFSRQAARSFMWCRLLT